MKMQKLVLKMVVIVALALLADPLFVAPEKFDLRLKPESPALKLGFKPIDLNTVGVRAKSKRSTLF